MVACPGTFGETLGQRADALLEWLCLHLEEEELPKGFDPRGRMLDVIRPGQDFGVTPNGGGGRAGGNGKVSGEALGKGGAEGIAEPADSVESRLLQYGFGHAEVASSIAAAAAGGGSAAGQGGKGGGGDAMDALDARTLGPLGVLSDKLVAAAGPTRKHGGGGGSAGVEEVQTEEEGREATDEEVMSLEAIYDGAVTVSPNMPEVRSSVVYF